MLYLCKGKKAGFLLHISSEVFERRTPEIELFIRSVFSDVRVQQQIASQHLKFVEYLRLMALVPRRHRPLDLDSLEFYAS